MSRVVARLRHAAMSVVRSLSGEKRTSRGHRVSVANGPLADIGLSLQRPVPEATPWPLQCANLNRHDPLSSARNRCTVTHYHNPAWTEESRFRGALDFIVVVCQTLSTRHAGPQIPLGSSVWLPSF